MRGETKESNEQTVRPWATSGRRNSSTQRRLLNCRPFPASGTVIYISGVYFHVSVHIRENLCSQTVFCRNQLVLCAWHGLLEILQIFSNLPKQTVDFQQPGSPLTPLEDYRLPLVSALDMSYELLQSYRPSLRSLHPVRKMWCKIISPQLKKKQLDRVLTCFLIWITNQPCITVGLFRSLSPNWGDYLNHFEFHQTVIFIMSVIKQSLEDIFQKYRIDFFFFLVLWCERLSLSFIFSLAFKLCFFWPIKLLFFR